MKLHLILVGLLSLLSFALAWTKEDYEIFDLVSAVESTEGKGTTFYSWLDISSKATVPEINKAYRKKSMQLHPDKNPGVKGINERYARLGVVAAILRDSERRERYDFFYKNGVPRWRGTGYYYSRYRPGLGSVVVFLVMLSSGLQLVVQKMNYKKDLERIDRFRSKARQAAWGPRMIPQPGAKKVRVSLSNSIQDEDGPTARFVDMLVEGEHVYLLGDDEPVLLDGDVATKPTIGNTWAINLIKALIQKALPKSDSPSEETATGQDQPVEVATSTEEDTDAGDGTDAGGNSAPSGSKVVSASGISKVAGRRRKVAPKKK
ncbi:hypothetical protein M407DRAFT_95742 [Tulasnella calospora MUT 4182]|uniref:J domain-containing protein n=1 Tax=Tulasnella calospora MUT 4182 TaxID=1051891 RepID=A0A0C3MGD1_9AGAM|nr:hypothetical protein M407DRAFT_95742 [Tulasnella calospora MUT 4182]